MVWSRHDPGAGDPGAIRTMANLRSTAATRLREQSAAPLRHALAMAGPGDWSADSGDAFRASVEETIPQIGILAAQHDNDARALVTYASAVETIAADAASLRVRERDNQEESAHLRRRRYDLMDDPAMTAQLAQVERRIDDAEAETRQHSREWDSLTERRGQADAACTASLTTSTSRGGLAHLAAGESVEGMTDTQFMRLLNGLSGAELLALLASDPTVAGRLASVKDAAAVAAWWQSLADPVEYGTAPLASSLQAALLEGYPASLGNLDGIWYTHRDIANRNVFEAAWGPIEDIAAGYFPLVRTSANSWDNPMAEAEAFLAKYGYTVAEFMAVYTELHAIDGTLDGAPSGAPPYQFIHYQPGDPTLAAISVGNMDTASQITTAVPGMGSTVTQSLHEWTLTAENLYAEQVHVNRLYGGGETGMAVVAWIGYDAPEMPPSPEVFGSDHAIAGAANLVQFMEGITATRDWDSGQNLSVVAHSYGTTTASLALAETPAENFVMVGSAGIDSSIPDVSHLQVDPANVWASEAAGDNIADLGRGEIDEWWFQGPILDPWMGESAVFEHQVNPTSDEYGANVFSSEGAYVVEPGQDFLDGEHLPGSDWHSTAPQVDAMLDGDQTDDYGYLDWGTNPLHNSALLSLGITEPVPPVPSDEPGSGGGGW